LIIGSTTTNDRIIKQINTKQRTKNENGQNLGASDQHVGRVYG